MLDLFSRALLHPLDYSGALRTKTLIFKEKVELIPNVYTFIFEMSEPFSWKAGQHGIFTQPEKKVQGKIWRAFSVASSPFEGVVRIATNIPETPSDFKKKLLELVAGHTVKIRGPFGEFHASKNPQHIIGIAGGIGITPFRSIAYEIAHGHLPETKLTLIYSASGDYTFKDELSAWEKLSHNLKIIYVQTPEEVNQTLKEQFEEKRNGADYYISGSPGMIKAIKQNCVKMGIKKIINDPFKGY